MVLDERRPRQGEASSTRVGNYNPPPHTIAAAAAPFASGSQYIDPLKRACLPRLAREQEVAPLPRSLTDRLNQMRVEDRRRERNKESRLNGTSSTKTASTFDATSSASARAGSLFHQSSQLAQKDQMERQQMCEMRRKFAGPTPPTSWRKGNEEGAVDRKMLEVACDDGPLARRRATHALSFFLDGGDREESLNLLSDLCLARIGRNLCDVDDQYSAELARETMSFLPIHLKERLMALAGREQQCEPLNSTALRLLFNDGGGVEPTGDSSESWELSADNTFDPLSLKIIDLSYARITVRLLKNVLAQGAGMHQLRALSLAGWGCDDRTGQKSLLTIYNLMEAIGNLSHLELLSIAKTRLTPVSKSDSSKTKETMMLESIPFLKRLSRSSLRLKVLDLSECDWIIGSDIASLGWYSVDRAASRSKIIWPRLEHLVLINCAAFMESTRVVHKGLEASPSYVAKWHAAHHGVALVTDSPYLLQHRPGLGNAVFRAEDAQQARQARQRQHARRQASIENAWGSPENSEEGEDGDTRSSSSSAYPTRCPVSGTQVGTWEWERARVLDAVRGRWGSAIKGDITEVPSGGTFVEIYF